MILDKIKSYLPTIFALLATVIVVRHEIVNL